MNVTRASFLTVLGIALLVGCAEAPKAPVVEMAPIVFPPPPAEPRFYFERTIHSSAEVTAKEESAQLRELLTGETARVGEGFGKPYGVAAHRGRVYIADSIGGAVKVLDIPGQRYFKVGLDEAGQLRQPLGVDVDVDGNIFVIDATQKLLKIYDPEGKFLRQVGGPQVFARPTGVGVDPAGERAYVVDTGGVDKKEEHRVRVFNAKTGEHLFDFGERGKGPGQFNLARDVAVAPNGTVYVVDTGNFRVQAFDRDGKYLFEFGGVGRFPGQFVRPREIAIDGSGNLYVSDAAFGNFQLFDPQGRLLLFVGDRAERDAPARYMLPAGIAVDRDGRVYMADQYFVKIDVYRPATLKPEEGFTLRAPAPAKSQ